MSSENGYIQMNKYIDTQPMVMNWEMDTFIIAVGTAGFAIIFSGLFVYLSLIFGTSFLVINVNAMILLRLRAFICSIAFNEKLEASIILS